jgi:hypothetical protein
VKERDERQAAVSATQRLSGRYRRLLAQEDRTVYIHLRGAPSLQGESPQLLVIGSNAHL